MEKVVQRFFMVCTGENQRPLPLTKGPEFAVDLAELCCLGSRSNLLPAERASEVNAELIWLRPQHSLEKQFS